MDQQKIAKEMIEFNKSMLDSSFKTISAIQDQSEKMFMSVIEKANWLPDDGKRAINDWVAAYKKGRNEFKMATDEKYDKVATYFLKQESTQSPGAKKSAPNA
jgi:uncharacterized coiled-coil DUF342 family protein